ncbi:MAG TPA: hypothetical protein VMV09_10665 [Candidatus Saccharimonadales bacterium]|nr:hypothetical protein [Candidatus Saccharimonadales bacterium]
MGRVATTEAAERTGSLIEPTDVRFTLSSLRGVEEREHWRFLNQFRLGVGWDGAGVVVMGTEAAGDVSNADDLGYECLQTTLILSGSPETVVRFLLKDSSGWANRVAKGLPLEPWRPVHVHPNDLDQVQVSNPFHTWCNLARVVAPRSEDWRKLMTIGASPGLGDLAYQIERSALPAKKSSGGIPPTKERTDWLVTEVIPALRQTARTLLIHGFGNSQAWDANGVELINVFRGYKPGTLAKVEWGPRPPKRGDWLWSHTAGAHRVVWSRALGWRWRPEYMLAVRAAVSGSA